MRELYDIVDPEENKHYSRVLEEVYVERLNAARLVAGLLLLDLVWQLM